MITVISILLWAVGLGLILTHRPAQNPTEKPPINKLGRFTLPKPDDTRWRLYGENSYDLGEYGTGRISVYSGDYYRSVCINGDDITEADASIKGSEIVAYCKAVKKAHGHKQHEFKAKKIQNIENGYRGLMEGK